MLNAVHIWMHLMCLSCNLSQAVFNLFSFGIEGCNVLSDETKFDDCLIQESSSPLPPQVDDPSKPNTDGITALHNAVCASHDEVVHFLVEYGADINSPDSHGW